MADHKRIDPSEDGTAVESESALEGFERQTALPMLVLAVAIIPLLLIPLLTDVSGGAKTAIVSTESFEAVHLLFR